ncbi:MAG TPA: BatD family protein [Thermoanaerobaculia bacterium]|nr:BatD family protein [Thermoanaerobaculia bacterium]
MRLLLLLAFALSARANELVVDARTLDMSDFATITVSLIGSFASNDFVEIPLQNLAFVGEPYVASEFVWINGQVVRRKVFRYRVRPIRPGPAMVGPIELNAEDGQVDRLAAVELQVRPDPAAGTNDPELVLREMLALGREPFFVVAEAEKQSLFAGEPVVITWVMYNAAVVQQWQVANVPKLADFWSEELTRKEQAERVYLGDLMVQRLPVRRVALYPLRSGRLRIEGLTLQAAIMRRIRSGPYGMYDGELVEATFTSAPVDLDVKPIPEGPAVDAVGELALACESPLQRGSGPVVVRVALTGFGNVRAAEPPRFERGVAGTLQIEGGQVSVAREELRAEMTRRWQYLIFPSKTGTLELPALTMRIFDPRVGVRRELRCPSTFLQVVATQPPEEGAPPPAEAPKRIPWPWVLGGAALLLALLIALPRASRELAIRREARAIVRDATPGEIRARMEQRVSIPLDEASDRGDAWRSLRSLLDAVERERDIAVGAEEEMVRRVREVLRSVNTRS